MTILQISEELAGIIHREAETRGVSIEEYLKSTIRREHTLAARQKIEQEQEWWFTLSLKERAKYEGKFVAVHNKKLIDHDEDEIALARRVREKYGNIPILIMPAEGPPELRIYSPRLVR
ncbi:MAG: DUF5678 domain-containing protein [Chloroflexota bacterium]